MRQLRDRRKSDPVLPVTGIARQDVEMTHTRQAVESSNIKSVGYHAESQTLEIEFTSGGVYQFRGVPAAAHTDLMQAPSVGKFFHAHIKHAFPFKKV